MSNQFPSRGHVFHDVVGQGLLLGPPPSYNLPDLSMTPPQNNFINYNQNLVQYHTPLDYSNSLPVVPSQARFNISALPGSDGSNPIDDRKYPINVHNSYVLPQNLTRSAETSHPTPSTSTSNTPVTTKKEYKFLTVDPASSDIHDYQTGTCRWKTADGICGHTIDSDWGNISSHLYKIHKFKPRKRSELVQCHWEGCKSKSLQASAMSRHVKTHLGFLKDACPKCGGVYSRLSSLERHIGYCTGSRKRKTKWDRENPDCL
ncbi:hypothetical protein GYMLUDRAFT_384331 [Collybiopsis luxurians FD-317 M1]|nr:hypothetical protein GYMLUDRAFT_384331 [Collybiopsis luxurians FD-317 M1]